MGPRSHFAVFHDIFIQIVSFSGSSSQVSTPCSEPIFGRGISLTKSKKIKTVNGRLKVFIELATTWLLTI